MNRVLLIVNVLLAAFLSVRALQSPTPANAAVRGAVLRTGDLQVEPEFGPDGAATAVRVVLPAGFAAERRFGEIVELGVRLDPSQPVRTTWRDARTLVVAPQRSLPRARRYSVAFGETIDGSAGARIEAGTVVGFATPPLRVLNVLASGASTERAAVTAVFDLPVTRAAAQKFVSLHDDGGRPVACDVTIANGGEAGTAVTLRPRSGFDVGDDLQLVVGASLVPAGGDVPLGEVVKKPVELRQPLRVRSAHCWTGGIELELNRSVDHVEPATVKVEPAVPFQVVPSERGVRLLGDFPPAAVVHVELLAGFPGAGDLRLAAPERRAVLFPHRPTQLDFAQGGSVLCASALRTLAVRGCNVKQPALRLQRVYPNNLVRALQNHDAATLQPAAALPLAAPTTEDETWTLDVDLGALAGGPMRGLWCATLEHGGSYWDRERRWLQVTDLGITWREGNGSAIAQVVDLVTGAAVADAAVTVLTPTNQELVRGTTDARGLLAVTWTRTADDRRPYLVLAQRGDDVAFVPCEDRVEIADEGLGGRPYAGTAPEAWVWTTRGIARPGETLDAAVLVRDAVGLPRPDLVLQARLRSPGHRVLQRVALQLGGSGLGHAAFPLPLDGATGEYGVEVVCTEAGEERIVGRTDVRVEAFVPDRLEVEVLAVSPLRFGKTGTVQVRGRWLEGAPAVGRRVTARVRLLPHALQFETAAGFTFASGSSDAPPGELPAVHGQLDEQGEAELEFALPAAARDQGLLANVAIELEDPSGRVVRAGRAAPVQRADRHLGLRTQAGAVELCLLDGEGAPLPGEQRVAVRLEQRHWVWRHEAAGDGRWRWRTTRTASTLGEWHVAVREGRGTLPLPPHGSDAFVVATLDGQQVEAGFGPDVARPDRLRVQAPTGPVASGGLARLVVTSPAAGRGLVTFETDRLHGACVVELQRGDTTLDVPVPAGLLVPNVHAVVTLTRPATASGPERGPAWLIGGASLRLARPELMASMTLTAPEQARPDDEWRATLVAPGATTALVALVDEGVLRITGHADPDPLAFLLASRGLGTHGADSNTALLEGMRFAPGSKTGGDGGDDGGLLVGSIDNRIRPFVRFRRVELDDAGLGAVAVPLDGYEGRVRAMVIAAGALGIATARAETIVRAPLGLQVATPRMVMPGDVFTLPITVRNGVGDGTVELELIAEAGLRLRGDGRHSVPLARDGERTLDIAVEAIDPPADAAVARLRVRGAIGEVARDVVAEFTVRAPRVRHRQPIGVELAAGGDVRVDDGWHEVEAHVRVDARPDPLLGPIVERLFAYPYGCAEQTASQGLALLACRTLLARWYGEQDPRVQAAPGMLEHGVQRLLGMQGWNGQFGYWADADRDGALTTYVTGFLVAAREHGVAVPEEDLARSLEALATLAQQARDPAVASQAIDVLARAGRPVQPWLDWLCTQALGVDERLRLAAVLGRLGQRERALALLGNDDETAPRAPATGDLASPLRSRALRLRALLAIDPRDPRLPELAFGLQRTILAQRGATTHENAHCVQALAEYYRQLPAPAAIAAASCTVDGRPVVLDGKPLAVRPGSVIAFAGGGGGFAMVELVGTRAVERLVPRNEGLQLTRTWIDVDTGLPVERCRRGGLYEVRVRIEATAPIAQLAVVDLLPGGFEAEPAAVEQAVRGDGTDDEAEATSAARAGRKPAATPDRVEASRCERRDDRVVLFFDRLGRDSEVRYRVRATFPGTWQQLPLQGEAMYDPEVRCVGATAAPRSIDP